MAPLRVPRGAWQPKPRMRRADASLPSAVRRFWFTTSPMMQLILVLPISRAATRPVRPAAWPFASFFAGSSMTVMQRPSSTPRSLLLLTYLEVLNIFVRRDRRRELDDHFARQAQTDPLDALAQQPLRLVEPGERRQRFARSHFRQSDRHAVVEIERRAPLPDTRGGQDVPSHLRHGLEVVHEAGGGAMRPFAGYQQQSRHPLGIERAHRGTGLVDNV